jgi:hypothetical protein
LELNSPVMLRCTNADLGGGSTVLAHSRGKCMHLFEKVCSL